MAMIDSVKVFYMKLLRRWWWTIVLVPVVAIIGFVMWASLIPAPMSEALDALTPSDKLTVETSPWLAFRPTGPMPETGLIFYPGGRVDARAYAPTARAVAEAGYLVVIVPMPLNLAVLAPERGLDVQAAFSTVRRWAIGGHSLGGAMAAQFAVQHPQQVQGLVLLAAYPPNTASLANSNLAVVSISGSQDGLATPDKIQASRSLLPATTQWVVIQGGNHAQFGWYGLQDGDNTANVSRADQQKQVITATLALLQSLANVQ